MKPESLKEFYERIGQTMPEDLLGLSHSGHFSVRRRSYVNSVAPYNRRTFYNISLMIGKGRYTANQQTILVERAAIMFVPPSVPLSYQALDPQQSGFYCLFNDAFLFSEIQQKLKYESPLFNDQLTSIISLDEAQVDHLSRYFLQMEELTTSPYIYRDDMIRTILQTLVHEGMRLQGPTFNRNITTFERVVARFYNLLDQQFPVSGPDHPLLIKTPAQYAEKLHVHVNYLNAALRKSADRSTREILQERLIEEAKVLLTSTQWDVAEIAFSLGFDYASHFNKYFKQYTAVTPRTYRETIMQQRE